MKKHWYKTHIESCPVCGHENKWKERVNGKKPLNMMKRIVVSYTYDHCLERENIGVL